jgi:hypothetical protein
VVSKKGEDTAMKSHKEEAEMVVTGKDLESFSVIQKMGDRTIDHPVEKIGAAREEKEGSVVEEVIEMVVVREAEDHKIEKIKK